MKDNSNINSLARPGVKSGKIRFVDPKDGKEHYFYTCINDLSGSRLSGFDNKAPSIDDSLSWIRSVFKDIRAKSEVLEVIGDF